MITRQRKTIVLVLFGIIILQLLLFGCQKKKEEVIVPEKKQFCVVSDTHIVANSLFNKENIEYYATSGKMLHLSETVLNTLADTVIQNNYEFLLISGDLTENGDEESHLAVASILKRIENAGIPVYVINGNHDIGKYDDSIKQNRFQEIYSDFGYNEADSLCEGTLCYATTILNKYRLIAIDDNTYTNEKTEEITDEERLWIYDRIDEANEKKLIPIIIAHKPFLNHWPKIVSKIEADDVTVKSYKMFCSYFGNNNAEIGFVGHNHLNDVTKYENYTEVETGSIIFGQSTYRLVSFSEESIDIELKYIENVDSKYFPKCLPVEIIEQINTNFLDYEFNHFYSYLYQKTLTNYLKSYVLSKISFGSENKNIENYLKEMINTVLTMPYYKKDEKSEEESLERILEKYNLTLPQSDYTNLKDFIAKLVYKLLSGDEELNQDEKLIVEYTVYNIFYLIETDKQNILNLLGEENLTYNINVAEIFSTGKVECYESNLIPVMLEIVDKSSLSPTIKNIIGIVEDDFESMVDGIGLFTGIIEGIDEDAPYFFTKYEINLKNILEIGCFNRYISDIVHDEAPSDRNLSIERLYSEE